MRPTERYTRTRLRCPNCGKPGALIIGAGRYPFVEHNYEPEINSGPSPCWLPREHPAVVAEREAAR